MFLQFEKVLRHLTCIKLSVTTGFHNPKRNNEILQLKLKHENQPGCSNDRCPAWLHAQCVDAFIKDVCLERLRGGGDGGAVSAFMGFYPKTPQLP